MDLLDVNDRTFESLVVGETASLTKDITGQAVARFVELSGDDNPMHVDEAYAQSTPFRGRIAHGQLVAAPISALAGRFLPGKRGLLLEVRAQFVQPVAIGDRLTYRGVIAHRSEATRTIKVRVEVTNQDGIAVLRGSYESRVLDHPTQAAS